jgi:hypothetical protein
MDDHQSENRSGKHETAVQQLLRARTRLLVCFLTLPLYVLAVWSLLSNGRDVSTLMWVYIALYAVFALDMVRPPLPPLRRAVLRAQYPAEPHQQALRALRGSGVGALPY